jgi:hypothetical protein
MRTVRTPSAYKPISRLWHTGINLAHFIHSPPNPEAWTTQPLTKRQINFHFNNKKGSEWSLSSWPWRKEEAVISIIYLVLIIPNPLCQCLLQDLRFWLVRFGAVLVSFIPVSDGYSHSPWPVSFSPWGLTTVTFLEHGYLTTYFMSYKSSFLYQFTSSIFFLFYLFITLSTYIYSFLCSYPFDSNPFEISHFKFKSGHPVVCIR